MWPKLIGSYVEMFRGGGEWLRALWSLPCSEKAWLVLIPSRAFGSGAEPPDPVLVLFKDKVVNKILNSEFCKPVRRRGDTSLKLKGEWGRGPRQLT